MKYIRVKDKIYKVVNSIYLKDVNFVKVDAPLMFSDIIPVEKIDMESDKIEELCDEFVFIDEMNEPQVVKRNIDWIFAIYEKRIVYGAVWTERGLKYVAKMNEKGELELL